MTNAHENENRANAKTRRSARRAHTEPATRMNAAASSVASSARARSSSLAGDGGERDLERAAGAFDLDAGRRSGDRGRGRLLSEAVAGREAGPMRGSVRGQAHDAFAAHEPAVGAARGQAERGERHGERGKERETPHQPPAEAGQGSPPAGSPCGGTAPLWGRLAHLSSAGSSAQAQGAPCRKPPRRATVGFLPAGRPPTREVIHVGPDTEVGREHPDRGRDQDHGPRSALRAGEARNRCTAGGQGPPRGNLCA
jgi:hypothetical protein